MTTKLYFYYHSSLGEYDHDDLRHVLEDWIHPFGHIFGSGRSIDGSKGNIDLEIDTQKELVIETAVNELRMLFQELEVPSDSELIVTVNGTNQSYPIYLPDNLTSAQEDLEDDEDLGDQTTFSQSVGIGNVYAVMLRPNLYGACRIIRAMPRSAYPTLIAATRWFGPYPPTVDNPQLHELLSLTFIGSEGPYVGWVEGSPPEEFSLIGTIEPTMAEQTLNRDRVYQWNTFCKAMLRQWRWENERDTLLDEDRRARKS